MRFSTEWSASVSDARDALKRLLQQRLEAGETSIVLESLRVSDLALGGGLTPSPRSSVPERPAVAEQPVVRESLAERRAPPTQGSGDWRAALKESGASTP